MKSDPPVLVYQDLVELSCNDDAGAYSSSVSRVDKYRNGIRFRQPADASRISVIDTQDELAAYRKEEELSSLRRQTFGDWSYFQHCPHCEGDLAVQRLNVEGFREIYAGDCPQCGWWETDHILSEKFDEYGFKHGVKSFHRRAVLKSFHVSSADVPVENLCEYLTRHPEKLEDVDPGKLEELVGHVFRETHACEVSYVGGPHDRGIDLYLARCDQEMVVQVKRRALRRGAQPAKQCSGVCWRDGYTGRPSRHICNVWRVQQGRSAGGARRINTRTNHQHRIGRRRATDCNVRISSPGRDLQI